MILLGIFAVLMVGVFGGLFRFALKATWTVTKFLLILILLPLALIVLMALGFIYIALPILIIVGIVAVLKRGSAEVAQ